MATRSINEAFAARRAELLAARQEHFSDFGEPDFAPYQGLHTKEHKLKISLGLLRFYASKRAREERAVHERLLKLEQSSR